MSYLRKTLPVPMSFVVAACDGCKRQRHTDEAMQKEAGDGYWGGHLTGARDSKVRDMQDANPGDGWTVVRKRVEAKETQPDMCISKGDKYVTTLHFCDGCAGRIG